MAMASGIVAKRFATAQSSAESRVSARRAHARPGGTPALVLRGGKGQTGAVAPTARNEEVGRSAMRAESGKANGELDAEAALLARFAAGDSAAAERLTAMLLPGVHRQAWRLLGDPAEAEDVAQEAMLRLWRQAASWRSGEAKASTWLYRVTRNLCVDRLRRRRSTTDIADVPEPMDPVPAVLDRLAAAEENRALAQAIGTLPTRQRDALLLRHFEGLSNPDIAARLDCSVEAVESLLARARRRLAADLREDDEDCV